MWGNTLAVPDAYSIFSHSEDSREEHSLSSSLPDSYSTPSSLQNSFNSTHKRGMLAGLSGSQGSLTAGFSFGGGLQSSRGWQTTSVGSPGGSGPDFLLDLALSQPDSNQTTKDPKQSCFWNVGPQTFLPDSFQYKFQKALEAVKKIDPSRSYEERERIWHKLAAISKDFAYCSKSYGYCHVVNF